MPHQDIEHLVYASSSSVYGNRQMPFLSNIQSTTR